MVKFSLFPLCIRVLSIPHIQIVHSPSRKETACNKVFDMSMKMSRTEKVNPAVFASAASGWR